jgi:hypothetical protein
MMCPEETTVRIERSPYGPVSYTRDPRLVGWELNLKLIALLALVVLLFYGWV